MIQNKRVCVHLSGIADVYAVFGTLVNVVQKVNILPHERYNNFVKVLDKMVKMTDQMNDVCIDDNCLWPRFHADIKELSEHELYQNVKIQRDSSSAMYQTRFAVTQTTIDLQTDPIQQSRDNVAILLKRMVTDLRNEVFEPTTIALIEKIRFMSDLHSLAKDLTKRGRVVVGAVNAKTFVEHARNITRTLDDISDAEIKDSYKQFLCNLESYVNQNDIKKLSSMSILKDFLNSKKLFEGAEIAMQAILCASVKISVESVVESLVSRYEGHFNKNRHLAEKNALDEMMIAENGPSLFRSDTVVSNAMNRYWKSKTNSGRWHFVRESMHVLDFGTNSGKTIMGLLNKPSKYPIMDS